ncbi:carboxyl transferase domain-containing protein [Phaeobacter sp. QD34_3]|uniref:carboxyl transferase domain-containing protein n=1 Tax=unclassified Phaeobacter TaxID=2621772 RepID=UPI00237F03F2|nr:MULTISPECIES: carboxyl transferase domain-containing protein [unclassified Phaeobacter]MDE4132592.1 carboxyl transferase domain-containing protein [Phaeobacter sp. QD34_3]MDE4136228.1 carboxyl transferase domain-containing protein [Phaeobacter sp. QD34_24]
MTIIRAESAAIVAEVHVTTGQEVPADTVLLATELMKMRHEIRAPHGGIVRTVHIKVGDELQGGAALVTLEPAEVAGQTAATKAEDRPDMADYKARMALLQDEARRDAVAKRHAQGARTARENIDDLFDAGSFTEYGALAVAAQRGSRDLEDLQARTQGDGIICGIGTVAGRRVAAMAVDYMVLAGTQGFNHHRKMDRLIEVAGRDQLPIVLFAEGGGGRPNDGDAALIMAGWLNVTSFRHFAAYKGPKIGIVAGYCFAGNAALFGVCDLRIATRNSWIGMGGPAMIEGGGLGTVAPKDIGPSATQVETGLIDILAEDEAEAVEAAKQLLGLSQDKPQPKEGDRPELRKLIPVDRTRAYDMRDAINGIVDEDSFQELRRGFGIGMITGFARLSGRAIGIVANNPLHLGGAIDAAAGDKGARFLQLCDAWGLPVVTFCDTPGFMVGPEVEKTGQVAHVSRLFLAGAHFSQPLVTLILRKAYGLGAMAMAGGGLDRPHFCCAWPTGEVGAMGLEGAVKLGHRDHLAAISDPQEREAEYQRLVDSLYERGKALNAASLLEFDAVIDPAETREVLHRALASAGPASPGPRYADAW